jgi:precorrin-4/cobalt-precorrin-4 C11-methyltransferase
LTVHFIGAGPGAADLITVRGRDSLASCPVCLYAGSLVPTELLAHCPPGVRLVNTAPLSLEEIVAEMQQAHAQGQDVARLHSGDLSIWSAMGEQLRSLRALDPLHRHTRRTGLQCGGGCIGSGADLAGVLPVGGADAHLGPGVEHAQRRNAGRLAATGAVLAIHLSVHVAEEVQQELLQHYGADCPAAIVWRASWPDELVVRTRVGELAAQRHRATPCSAAR